jgi:hypothetical protein
MYKSWAEFKRAWTKALRSGRYKQGKEYLVNEKDEFCCLGVAANLLIEAGHKGEWFKDRSNAWEGRERWYFGHKRGRYDDCTLALTPVPAWLREKLYDSPEGDEGHPDFEDALMQKNDNGVSFKKIADYIDREM